MTEQQQKLYDKLLKKVNEFCLGQAAEDVIAAIDNLVESYESRSALEDYENTKARLDDTQSLLWENQKKLKALEIIKKQIHSLDIYKGNFYFDGERISQEEYELLKEVLK